jgi:hypothetical protein
VPRVLLSYTRARTDLTQLRHARAGSAQRC